MKYCPVVKGHDIRSVRQNTLFCSASFGPWTLQSRTFSSLLLSPGRTVPTSCRAAALQVTFTFLHMEVQSPPAAPKTWDPSQFKSRFGQKKNNQCGCRDLTEAKGSESLQKCDVFHGVIHSIWAACSLLTKRQEPEQLHGGPGSIVHPSVTAAGQQLWHKPNTRAWGLAAQQHHLQPGHPVAAV